MRLASLGLLLPLPLVLTGCSMTPTATSSPASILHIQGRAHGGLQPIVGAHIYLYAASNSGYGAPSNPLLNTSSPGVFSDSNGVGYVVTDQSGSFDISTDYRCVPNTQTYLYSVGGDTGQNGKVNTAAGLLAVTGNCPSGNVGGLAGQVPYVFMNEVSTIAAAYALSGFAVDATHISSAGTDQSNAGLFNAFNNALQIENIGTGTVLTQTPQGGGIVPSSKIHTLANILASCINSPTAGSSSCTTLAQYDTSTGAPGGAAPTDTATAAIYMAHNPVANAGQLYKLQVTGPGAPYYPDLATAPADLTVSVNFPTSGSSVNSSIQAPTPSGIAIDNVGRPFVTDTNAGAILEFNPAGGVYDAAQAPGAAGIALDPNHDPRTGAVSTANGGVIWTTGRSANSAYRANIYGTPLTTTTGAGLSQPLSVAIDQAGNAWMANAGNSILSSLVTTGTDRASGGFGGNGLSPATGVAVGIDQKVWVTSSGSGGTISIFNNDGSAFSQASPVTGDGLSAPAALAVDHKGRVWIANSGANSLGLFAGVTTTVGGVSYPSGTVIKQGYVGGGLSAPRSLAIDGSGNVWVANGSGNISEFDANGNALSGTGMPVAGATGLSSIAVDPSGNVWVTDPENGGVLAEFLGAATPVVTPIQQGLQTVTNQQTGAGNTLGVKP